MNMTKFFNKWSRKLHKWIGIPAVFTVIFSFVVKRSGNLEWRLLLKDLDVVQSPMMLILAITGAYLVTLPYYSKWQRKRRRQQRAGGVQENNKTQTWVYFGLTALIIIAVVVGLTMRQSPAVESGEVSVRGSGSGQPQANAAGSGQFQVDVSGIEETPTPVSAPDVVDTDLGAIKTYLTEHGNSMQAQAAAFLESANGYYNGIQNVKEKFPDENPYERMSFGIRSDDVANTLANTKENWIAVHNEYELIEGIVAGVPSLWYFHGWIDAGLPCTEISEECVAWSVQLPDGTAVENGGDILQLTEATLWGTVDAYTALAVDLDSDGSIESGEVYPDADMLLGGAQALYDATVMMNERIAKWEPTMEDVFAAMLGVLPTLDKHFEEWKLSSFVTSANPRFVAQSRLVDIKGMTTGLSVLYAYVSPGVEHVDVDLDQQIKAGFEDLLGFLDGIYQEEQDGKRFSSEEADALGAEAQDKAQALASLIVRAGDELKLVWDVEADGWEPAQPPAIISEPVSIDGLE